MFSNQKFDFAHAESANVVIAVINSMNPAQTLFRPTVRIEDNTSIAELRLTEEDAQRLEMALAEARERRERDKEHARKHG